MKAVGLRRSGVAFIPVNLATFDGRNMFVRNFLVDTGATETTIPKSFLMEQLGYTAEYIEENKVMIPQENQPTMANGDKADVYKLPITRINIGEHEIKHEYILSSDNTNFSFLLGLDILKYFRFIFDFDAITEDFLYGQMLYEFRKSQQVDYRSLDEKFAHKIK